MTDMERALVGAFGIWKACNMRGVPLDSEIAMRCRVLAPILTTAGLTPECIPAVCESVARKQGHVPSADELIARWSADKVEAYQRTEGLGLPAQTDLHPDEREANKAEIARIRAERDQRLASKVKA